MNKLMKVALMTICVGTMLGLAGCGNAESQYESILREGNAAINGGKANEQEISEAMKEFRAMTPEHQKAELEKTKKEWAELKKLAK